MIQAKGLVHRQRCQAGNTRTSDGGIVVTIPILEHGEGFTSCSLVLDNRASPLGNCFTTDERNGLARTISARIIIRRAPQALQGFACQFFVSPAVGSGPHQLNFANLPRNSLLDVALAYLHNPQGHSFPQL